MLGQTEDISPSIKKSMTNPKKKFGWKPHAHSCFKQFLWKNKGANCASMISTVESPKLLEEFLYDLFETKLKQTWNKITSRMKKKIRAL